MNFNIFCQMLKSICYNLLIIIYKALYKLNMLIIIEIDNL
jgi:hypothetical protein